MGGAIFSDVPGNQCSCGTRFQQVSVTIFEKEITVPKCPNCGKAPDRIRISRWVPSRSGAGKHIIIRHSTNGVRLKGFLDALVVMEQIDKEIKNETFDASNYGSKVVMDRFKFSCFVENDYLPAQDKRLERGEITPSGLKDKKSLYKCHLKEFFGNKDLRFLRPAEIKLFRDNYTTKIRTRNKAIDELRCILRDAFEKELIEIMPAIPKPIASNVRSGENILAPEEVERVCANITNPIYQKMIRALWIYPIRPSEIRALQWGDIDFKEGLITVRRHFSDGNKLIEGRKSQRKGKAGAVHYLKLKNGFLRLIEDLPRPLDKSQYVFRGGRQQFVSGNVLPIAWNEALKKAGISREVQLYEGTKHSRVSYLHWKGYSIFEISELTGTSPEVLRKRYVFLDGKEKAHRAGRMIE